MSRESELSIEGRQKNYDQMWLPLNAGSLSALYRRCWNYVTLPLIRTRAQGLRASCHGVLSKPLDRRIRTLKGYRFHSAERINLRGSPGLPRTSAGTVIRISTSGPWANEWV